VGHVRTEARLTVFETLRNGLTCSLIGSLLKSIQLSIVIKQEIQPLKTLDFIPEKVLILFSICTS
jgi:hypothetical protein